MCNRFDVVSGRIGCQATFGVFAISKSIAEAFGISRASVYNYMAS